MISSNSITYNYYKRVFLDAVAVAAVLQVLRRRLPTTKVKQASLISLRTLKAAAVVARTNHQTVRQRARAVCPAPL